MISAKRPYTMSWVDAAAEPNVVAVVVEAYLPVLAWPKVTIRRCIDEEITPVERFLLEFARDLGWVNLDTVEEVTDLPVEASRAVADRLVEFGLLRENQGRYDAEHDAIEDTLTAQVLRRRILDSCDVVVLPRTGDVLAFGVPLSGRNRRSSPRPQFELLPETHPYPVPSWLFGRRPSEIVRELLTAGKIVGLPPDVEQVVGYSEDQPISEACPAYKVYGKLLPGRNGPRIELRADMRRSKGEGSIKLDLTGAARLGESWSTRAALLDDQDGLAAVAHALGCRDPNDLEPRQVDPTVWSLRLNEKAAKEVLDSGHHLDDGILVIDDAESIIEVAISLEPHGGDAAEIFALDRAIRTLLNQRGALLRKRTKPPAEPTSADNALREAEHAFGLGPGTLTVPKLEAGLWALGEYGAVYELRKDDDFAYDQ